MNKTLRILLALCLCIGGVTADSESFTNARKSALQKLQDQEKAMRQEIADGRKNIDTFRAEAEKLISDRLATLKGRINSHDKAQSNLESSYAEQKARLEEVHNKKLQHLSETKAQLRKELETLQKLLGEVTSFKSQGIASDKARMDKLIERIIDAMEETMKKISEHRRDVASAVESKRTLFLTTFDKQPKHNEQGVIAEAEKETSEHLGAAKGTADKLEDAQEKAAMAAASEEAIAKQEGVLAPQVSIAS